MVPCLITQGVLHSALSHSTSPAWSSILLFHSAVCRPSLKQIAILVAGK